MGEIEWKQFKESNRVQWFFHHLLFLLLLLLISLEKKIEKKGGIFFFMEMGENQYQTENKQHFSECWNLISILCRNRFSSTKIRN